MVNTISVVLPTGQYELSIPTPPADMVVSPINATGNPILDADDPTSIVFDITDAENLLENENGTGDDATSSFPDDHALLIFDYAFSALDFGDLPNSFANTTNADNGAYHVVNPSICLGMGVDAEVDGTPDANSGVLTNGDDATVSAVNEGTVTAGKDEDGIEFISPMIPGEKAYVKITAKSALADGFVNAWIDFSGDGTLDASEQVMWTGVNGGTIAATTNGIVPQGAAVSEQIFCFDVPMNAIFDGGETTHAFSPQHSRRLAINREST